MDEVGVAVLVRVDADFGPRGPSLTACNRAGRGEKYLVGWPDLARVLGQDVPYWPSLLRDPDLIAAWRPGAAAVTAPARTNLDSDPLLRMAAMFDAAHPHFEDAGEPGSDRPASGDPIRQERPAGLT